MGRWGKKKKGEASEPVANVSTQEDAQGGDELMAETDEAVARQEPTPEAPVEAAAESPVEEAPEVIDPASVKEMREIDQEQMIAIQKGWNRLGRFFLEVTKPLSDEIKLQVAKAQSEAMMEIGRLELEKKAFNSDIKGKIEDLQAAAIEAAKKILHGEHVENGHFPAFFDPETKERVYYDIAKGEEVRRIEARREDYQLKIDPDAIPQAPVVAEAEGEADAAPSDSDEVADQGDGVNHAVYSDPEKVPCDSCNADGAGINIDVDCSRCAGSGEIFAPVEAADPEVEPAAEGEVKKDEWREDEQTASGADVSSEEEARAS